MVQFLNYLFFILVSVLLSVLFMRKASSYHFYIKKSLHISVILICAHASVYLPTLPLFIIVSLVFILLSWAIFKGFLSDPISKEKEWGVLYFVGVFAVMLLIVILKNQQELKVAAAYSLTVLAISDGLAGIFGRAVSVHFNRKKEKRNLINEIKSTSRQDKSLIGLLVFVCSCTTIIFYYLKGYTEYSLLELIGAAIMLSVVLGITEFISKKGSDNFTVTLFSFLLLRWLTNNSFEVSFKYSVDQYLLLVFVSIILLIGLYRLKFLTFSGSISAWLLAFVVVILANQSLLPLLVFLILGSVIGKLPVNKIVSDERFSKPRNASQVFANGGIVFILGIITWGLSVLGISNFNHVELQKLMLVSVAVCMSDTASSELGSRFGGVPVDVLTFKPITAGVSGGVTLLGTCFGLIGSLIIVIIGYYLIPISLLESVVILLFGFLGMLLDSFIGSKFQYKVYVNGQWLDTTNEININKYKGFKFITNNAVNFISNILIILLMLCYLKLF